METYEPLTDTDSEVSADEVTEATTAENSTSADETVSYTEVAENTVVFTEERAQQVEVFITIVIMAIVFAFVVFSFKAVYRLLRIFF